MPANWTNVIRSRMQPISVLEGEASNLYIPPDKTQVFVITAAGEFPPPPPPLERWEVAPTGGRDITFDVSDPDFLVLQKVVGVTEYVHYIPWDKVVDLVFRTVS